MLTVWFGLLVGCVLFGAAIVAALVLPRTLSPLAGIAGLAAIFGAVTAMGSIVSTYRTTEATFAGAIILLAGITSGYAVAATALPQLARAPRSRRMRVGSSDSARSADGRAAIVLVCCTEPEHYSAWAIAERQNLLSEKAGIDVPPTALPFVFFAEKARYRAAGNVSPGPGTARRLAELVSSPRDGVGRRVELAWCHTPASLAAQVAALRDSGATPIAVVVLGLPESGPLDEMLRLLDEAVRDADMPQLVFGTPLWNDRLLPSRLAERIMASTAGADPSEVGVVLVGEGYPPQWERQYPAAESTENYFNQRVRMLLGEAGVDDHNVRPAWLNWQTPDITEAVRHLAALGCTRIVVAPSTIALPTLETVLDVGHEVVLARVPDNVRVVTLLPWGDDDGFGDAVRRSADEALERAGIE